MHTYIYIYIYTYTYTYTYTYYIYIYIYIHTYTHTHSYSSAVLPHDFENPHGIGFCKTNNKHQYYQSNTNSGGAQGYDLLMGYDYMSDSAPIANISPRYLKARGSNPRATP